MKSFPSAGDIYVLRKTVVTSFMIATNEKTEKQKNIEKNKKKNNPAVIVPLSETKEKEKKKEKTLEVEGLYVIQDRFVSQGSGPRPSRVSTSP